MPTSWRRVGSATVALVLGLAACSSDGGSPDPATTTARPRPTTTTTVAPTTTTTPTAAAGALAAAACADGLVAARGATVTEPLLTEASGIAPDGEVTWVLNDSGDEPRLYGLADDGTARVVAVTGAEAVDWEDLARVGGEEPHLWIADTGGNIAPRPTAQLYRVPIPAPGVAEVAAERVDVTYPDGPHDVEAVIADPDGPLYLLSKEPARSRIYRVDPPEGGGPVTAELVGEFRPGEGPATLVTSAAIAPDRQALVVRSYGGAFLYPLPDGGSIPAALADDAARCRAPVGLEVQGEAIGFLADGSGYATIGEGANPVVTTVTAAG